MDPELAPFSEGLRIFAAVQVKHAHFKQFVRAAIADNGTPSPATIELAFAYIKKYGKPDASDAQAAVFAIAFHYPPVVVTDYERILRGIDMAIATASREVDDDIIR